MKKTNISDILYRFRFRKWCDIYTLGVISLVIVLEAMGGYQITKGGGINKEFKGV